MKHSRFGIFAFALLGAAGAWGDTVYMKDGSTREGTVVKRTPDELQLRIDSGGMKATVTYPMTDVARVAITPARGTVVSPEVKPAGDGGGAAVARTMPAKVEELARRGFLIELGATALGNGPDNPARLPEKLRTLWETAMHREILGNPSETLDGLRALDDAFSPIKGGLARLDGISRHERKGQSFGEWLAQVHWEVIGGPTYNGGPVDLSDVRDSERRAFIGILKERGNAVLETLKPYFPRTDPVTGKAEAFNPSQLGGIGLANAVEVKRAAMFANSYLLAQIKIEPGMPAVDRLLLASELQTVQRILARANEVVPAAKAAAEKAEREKRIAEEKARHGG